MVIARPTQSLARHDGGFVLAVAVIGLVVLLFLSVTLLSISQSMTGHSARQVRSAQALAAGEAACSRGLVMLEQGVVSSVPYVERDIPLAARKMDLQIVRVEPEVSGASEAERYEIFGTGHSGNVQRTVALGVRQDSFLRYSRFLESGTLRYSAGVTIAGQVYAGGDISLGGYPATFLDQVTTSGQICNREQGIFSGGAEEYAAPLSLSGSMDEAHYRALSQQAGIYYKSGTPLIDLALFELSGDMPTYDGVPLGRDFNGVVFCEHDIAVEGVLEGRSLTIVAGDDIIISGNIRTGCSTEAVGRLAPRLKFSAPTGQEVVQSVALNGLMDGLTNTVKLKVSGPKWQRFNMYLYEGGNLLGVATLQRPADSRPGSRCDSATILSQQAMDPTRHDYTAEIHFWSQGPNSNPTSGKGTNHVWVEVAAGDPVNVGLIARDYVYISKHAPRVLTVEAALFSRDANWRPTDYSDGQDADGSHPACHGVWDLDGDGRIESPNEDGYDEARVDGSTWALSINGPIITRTGGSAGAWSYQGQRQGKGTRHYNYDRDIIYYEPPHFPVILSQWQVLYWREV